MNWHDNENWRSEELLGQWHGVTADSDGRVTSLDLEDNRLTGVAPTELMQLTGLRSLVITSNETCLPGDAAFSTWLAQVEFDGAFCPTEESAIDIAIFYTPAAREKAGGARFLETSFESFVAATNQIYSEEGVGIRLSIVLLDETDYSEGTDGIPTHTRRLRFPDDGYMDEVHAKRDAVGADLVHLVVVRPDETQSGLSYQLINVSVQSATTAFGTSTRRPRHFALRPPTRPFHGHSARSIRLLHVDILPARRLSVRLRLRESASV